MNIQLQHVSLWARVFSRPRAWWLLFIFERRVIMPRARDAKLINRESKDEVILGLMNSALLSISILRQSDCRRRRRRRTMQLQQIFRDLKKEINFPSLP